MDDKELLEFYEKNKDEHFMISYHSITLEDLVRLVKLLMADAPKLEGE